MPRKSISYLTSLRLDVTNTSKEMLELATDMQAAIDDVSMLSPEQVRSDLATDHVEQIKHIQALHKALGKQIRDHKHAADLLRQFF
jgi:hypothetical protein